MTTIKICFHCESKFVPKRSDAKFCSPKCRLDAFKERKESDTRNHFQQEESQVSDNRQYDSVHLEGMAQDGYQRNSRLPKPVEDLYNENGIFPYRYPLHFYTPYGRLTAVGWRGIDPMDREALKHKDWLCTDYQWLETQVSREGQILNIYDGLIDDFFPEEKPKEEPQKKEGPAGWTDRERKAVNRYVYKARLLVEEFQSWVEEEGVSYRDLKLVVKGMRRYLKSQVYLDVPADCPRSFWIEATETRIGEYYEGIEDGTEWIEMVFSQDWQEQFEEVLEELDEFDASKG